MKPVSILIRSFVVTLLAAFASTAMAITGVWSGPIRDSAGNGNTVTYKFSAAGYPMLGFATRKGWREIEVQHVGQRHEWLLPGPGYGTGVVESLHVTRDRVQVVLAISTTSGGGALIDQGQRRLALDFKLGANGLETVIVRESVNHSSGAGLGLYAGSRARSVAQGVLRRAD